MCVLTRNLTHTNTWRSTKHTKRTRAALFRPSLYICHLFLNVIIAEFRSQPTAARFGFCFYKQTKDWFFPCAESTSDKLLHAVRPKDREWGYIATVFWLQFIAVLEICREKENRHFNTFDGRNIWPSESEHYYQLTVSLSTHFQMMIFH